MCEFRRVPKKLTPLEILRKFKINIWRIYREIIGIFGKILEDVGKSLRQLRNTFVKMLETWKNFFKTIGKVLKKFSLFFEIFRLFKSEKFCKIL